MALGELLRASFGLYRRNFTLFAGISLVLGVPQSIITSLLTAAAAAISISSTSSEQSVQVSSIPLGSSGSVGLIALAFGALIAAVLALAICRLYLGEKVTVEAAYVQLGWRRFRGVLGAAVVVMLTGIVLFVLPFVVFLQAIASGSAFLVFGAAILFVGGPVGIVLLVVRCVFAPQAIVFEGLGAVDGLRSSWRLVTGDGWAIFGVVAVLSIIAVVLVIVISSLITGVFPPPHDRGVKFLTSFISSLLLLSIEPFPLTVLTLLYFDLRARKGGLDLEQIASSLGRARPS
jgi:hypothetical protein